MPTLNELLTAIRKIQGIDPYSVPDKVLAGLIRTVLSSAAPDRQWIGLNQDQVWHRGHKLQNADGYSSKQRLLYHPSPTEFNRANGPGEPMMYASRNWGTVACELDIKTGDILQLVTCRVKPALTVRSEIIGEFEAVANSGLSLIGLADSVKLVEKMMKDDPERWQRTLLADAFCAELFSQRIPKGRSERYKPTAIIAFYLIHAPAEVLMFPSVQRRGGMNVAVPGPVVDAKFEICTTDIVRVRNLGFGQFDAEPIRMSERFDGDTVVWAPKPYPRSGTTWSLTDGLRFVAPTVTS